MSAQPRNEFEASRSLGGGSSDTEIAKAFQLSDTHQGDNLTGGHRENMQTAGGIVEGVTSGSEQFLDLSIVIPQKYTPVIIDEEIPPIELMHLDFDTPD